MKHLLLVAVFTLFLNSAWAQVPGILPFEKAIPHSTQLQSHKIIQKTLISQQHSGTNYSLNDVKKLAFELNRQFQAVTAPLTEAAPDCEDSKALGYVQALQATGRFDSCVSFVKACMNDKKTLSPAVFTVAALCEGTRFNTPAALEFFQAGAKSKWQNSEAQREHIFQYVTFLLSNGFENQVDDVLQKYPGAGTDQQSLVKAVIKRFLRSDLGGLKKEDVDNYLGQMAAKANGSFKGLLLAIQTRIYNSDYKYPQALASLFKNAEAFGNPLLWYDLAYDILYYGLDQNFAWAREVYDVSDRYSNPWRNFPSEANTYNYTEIYSRICKDELSQGEEKVALDIIKANLREGKITAQDALAKVLAHDAQYPGRADVLTLKANLLFINGQPEGAMQNYWLAHKLCRYFNRANWGLTLIKRFYKYKQLPDFQENLDRMEQRLAQTKVPQEISKYFINWSSLDSESKRRIIYGGWIWMPYIPNLLDNDMKTYIKYAFDLLSESPGLSEIRDVRIGGAQYPNDNRLWDDVRGLGGNPVVADLAEVFQTPQGDYNLLGHEMAHQFQFLMESKYPAGVQCIDDLYKESKEKKNFPDGYSAYNREEHFAQGVTYYLVPEESSSHFGLNRSWVRKNNPRQYKFIQSIEISQGQYDKISCEKTE